MYFKRSTLCVFLLCSALLSACGFRLRGDYLLPPELQKLYVSSEDKYGELTRVLKKHLQLNHVKVMTNYTSELPELHILKDTLSRRTLSIFPNGQVAEYELIYTARYQIKVQDKNTQSFRIELNRDYQDNPNIALAKSRELALLLSEMRKEAADKILRNMASVQL